MRGFLRIGKIHFITKHKRGLVGSDQAQFKNNVSKNMQTGMSFIYRQKILFLKKFNEYQLQLKTLQHLLLFGFFAFCFLNSLESN